jgi:hypothetical protein
LFDPVTFIGGVLGGGAFGSIITLFVAGRRDKKGRRRNFIAFLEEWKQEFSLPGSEVDPLGRPAPLALSRYLLKLPDFRREAAKSRDVFADTKTFDSLCDRLGGLKAEDWQKRQPREIILEAIDALLEFAK